MRDRSLQPDRYLRGEYGRFSHPPWFPDLAAWRFSKVRDLIGASGKPERWLLHQLLLDGWSAENAAETLARLEVVRERPFGQPFDYVRLPDERRPRRQDAPMFPMFKGPSRGTPPRPAPGRPARLGGPKV
jgi:hypothetical protein